VTILVTVGAIVLVAVGGMGVIVLVTVGTRVEVSVGVAVDVGISAIDCFTGAVGKIQATIIPTKNRLNRTIG